MKISLQTKTYTEALRDAFDICLSKYPTSFLIGAGVPDPKGIFGTTLDLQKKYGRERVMDMPISENAITGMCIGAAVNGLRPILNHQRLDFSLLALDQVINNAAKWSYMFNGIQHVPLVIRMIIGRGWGQGPQHSQALHALYAHIPGLKVVMPTTPADAKGLMIAAIEDSNPVIFIEHRWLHTTYGPVPSSYYRVPIGKARIAQKGEGITIVTSSYSVIESLRAVSFLHTIGVRPEIIDVRTIQPLDCITILASVRKTKRLLVVDPGNRSYGVAAEIIALVAENKHIHLKERPHRITLPDIPAPTTPALTKYYYPHSYDIARAAVRIVRGNEKKLELLIKNDTKKENSPHDIPHKDFRGPF